MKILSNQCGCPFCRIGDMTGQLPVYSFKNRADRILDLMEYAGLLVLMILFHVEQIVLPVREVRDRLVTWLGFGL